MSVVIVEKQQINKIKNEPYLCMGLCVRDALKYILCVVVIGRFVISMLSTAGNSNQMRMNKCLGLASKTDRQPTNKQTNMRAHTHTRLM